MKIHDCYIWWNVHGPHVWFHTDEGGGHMLNEAFVTDEPAIWCEGIKYVPRHRGWPRGKWSIVPETKNPKHRRR